MKPRKLILSRKGFDSSAGGCPSPIFLDGTMLSLPIPSPGAQITYGGLHHGGVKIGQLVDDLTRRRYPENRITARHGVHLDPDVKPDAYHRREGWRGLFGQADIAQQHLEGQGVGAGDVFLFFGLYRRVQETQTGWRFVRGAPQQHILWGWLQIEQVCKVDEIRNDTKFWWAHYHDHFRRYDDPSNTLYVASHRLDLGDSHTAPGAGVFPRLDARLLLTEPDRLVSQWRLPRWFYPDGKKTSLTYHGDRARWKHDDKYSYLQSVGRGQEFVLDLQQYPEALGWISGLVRDFGGN